MKLDEKIYRGRAVLPSELRKDVEDPLGVEAWDHLEIYSPSAKETAYYFSRAFGFHPIAYRGPETGYRDAASYVMRQGDITLVITGALRATSPISSYVHTHGTSVRDVALRVKDCAAFYYEALRRGAQNAEPPSEYEDEQGVVLKAAIRTYGDTIHSIIERKNYKGVFWPGFVPYKSLFVEPPKGDEVGLLAVDHLVGNVELGKMEHWVRFYENVLGFSQMQHFSDDQISTEYSALMSKVMSDGKGKVKFPINEPAKGKRKSQIDEYLDFHNGPGVQHIAMVTNDIIATVSELKRRGVVFLKVPKTYYDEVPDRVGPIKQDLQRIAELGILVDRDEDGYLLQLFTKPLTDRPTLFFEIIQREGSHGFGIGNFKALFEAIERDQAARGNL